MTTTVDAIFENGVLRPVVPLDLPEHQRVRVTVSDVAPQLDVSRIHPDRLAAIAMLRESIRTSSFHSTKPFPTRADLYDRRSP